MFINILKPIFKRLESYFNKTPKSRKSANYFVVENNE